MGSSFVLTMFSLARPFSLSQSLCVVSQSLSVALSLCLSLSFSQSLHVVSWPPSLYSLCSLSLSLSLSICLSFSRSVISLSLSFCLCLCLSVSVCVSLLPLSCYFLFSVLLLSLGSLSLPCCKVLTCVIVLCNQEILQQHAVFLQRGFVVVVLSFLWMLASLSAAHINANGVTSFRESSLA